MDAAVAREHPAEGEYVLTLVLGALRSAFTGDIGRLMTINQYKNAVLVNLGLTGEYEKLVEVCFFDDRIPFRANMIYFDGGGRLGIPGLRESIRMFSEIVRSAMNVHFISGYITPTYVDRLPEKGEFGMVETGMLHDYASELAYEVLAKDPEKLKKSRLSFSSVEVRTFDPEVAPFIPIDGRAAQSAIRNFLIRAYTAGPEAWKVLHAGTIHYYTGAIEAQICSNCRVLPATGYGKTTNKPFCSKECMIGASRAVRQ